MKAKEQWIEAIENQPSEVIADLIMQDVELIEKLRNKVAKLEQENAVLKTLVPNNQRYTYGVR